MSELGQTIEDVSSLRWEGREKICKKCRGLRRNSEGVCSKMGFRMNCLLTWDFHEPAWAKDGGSRGKLG